jgi:hypothetical protein
VVLQGIVKSRESLVVSLESAVELKKNLNKNCLIRTKAPLLWRGVGVRPKQKIMALYYLPVLIRSDRYFVARLERSLSQGQEETDFNFVVHAEDRVLTPLLTIEDPGKIVLNQMAPSDRQDIPLRECHISLHKDGDDFELIIKKNSAFVVEPFNDEESGLRLDYSADQKRVSVGFYKYNVEQVPFQLKVTLVHSEDEKYSGQFQFTIVRSKNCQRVVIDFGSEASQVGYKNCGPQSDHCAI